MNVDVMAYIIFRNRVPIVFVFIFLIIMQYSFFYKVRIESILQSTYIESDAPYLKIQRNLSKLINTSVSNYPYKGAYLHETKTLCTTATNLTLLIIILSSTKNFHKRRIVRETWANETYYRLYGNMKTAFLLGRDDDVAIQTKIDEESSRYGDIVQGGFIDSYHNLTYKSTMGFRWAAERCRNAKYVLKTDDDIVINLFMLFQNNTFSESEDDFHVFCHRQDHPIFRNPDNKWFVDESQFKGLEMYPTYCGGSFVLLSNKVVPYFYESLKRTPFFWVEDVLLYGIALNNIQKITYKQVSNKNTSLDTRAAANLTLACLEQHRRKCPIFVTMSAKIAQIPQVWAKILEVYSN